MTVNDLTSRYEKYRVLDDRTILSAAKAVAINIPDRAEALLIMDMLGLVPPQPGYEAKTMAQADSARQKELRKEHREEKAERERLKKEKFGITPDEIGEPEDEEGVAV